MRAKSSSVKPWTLPMQIALNSDFIWVLFLGAAINGALALWVYSDSKSQERSGFWALGTFFLPQAFFPLYFWNQVPELIWTCPKCQRDNRAWSRKCGRCNQFYTAEETVARLHGYLNPSDPVVIILITFLFQEVARGIAILMAEGFEVLTETDAVYTLPVSYFWSVKLVIGNVLIWLSLFCITGRYRRTIRSIGLGYNGSITDFGLPFLLAPRFSFCFGRFHARDKLVQPRNSPRRIKQLGSMGAAAMVEPYARKPRRWHSNPSRFCDVNSNAGGGRDSLSRNCVYRFRWSVWSD